MEQLTAADQQKRTDLRRMKVVATSFLVGATVIFFGTHAFEGAWVGYVRAAAEAGMVGALADWFAVTALFRRPLGLPIPHTAIIPTRKNMFGKTLGDFVGVNFLSPEVVQDKLRRAGIAERAGAWIKQPDNAERVTNELANVIKGAITVLRDEEVQAVVEHAIVKRVTAQPWGPPLGKLLNQVLTDGAHHKLVDLMCDRAYEWVRDNYDKVSLIVTDRAPTWSPKFVDSLLGDKVYTELVNFAWAVKTDVNHPMRLAVDQFLLEFSTDMQNDPSTMQRAEQVKQQVINHPDVQKLINSAWGTAKKMLIDAAEDPSSELRRRVTQGLITLGTNLTTDEELRAKVDGWLEQAAGYVVNNYRAEITTLITDTVERWDAEETSRKIELQVGRDLQFIRINGTVVGALAGLVIYTVANALF